MFKKTAIVVSLLSLASLAAAEEQCIPLIPFGCPQGYAEFGYARSLVGHHIWWFYRDAEDKLAHYSIMCVHGTCNLSNFVNGVVGISMTPNAVAEARHQLEIFPKFDCAAHQEVCDQQKIYIAGATPRAELELPKKIVPPVVVVPPPPASAPVPAIVYVVEKAASTSPDGKKPVYDFTPPSTLKVNGLRIAPGTVCGTLVYKSYYTVPGGVAVCIKQ